METSIFVIAIIATQGSGYATEQAANAYARQNHLDERLDKYSRTLTTPATRAKLDNVGTVLLAVVNRQVVFKWEF